jgi:hypothetical protein
VTSTDPTTHQPPPAEKIPDWERELLDRQEARFDLCAAPVGLNPDPDSRERVQCGRQRPCPVHDQPEAEVQRTDEEVQRTTPGDQLTTQDAAGDPTHGRVDRDIQAAVEEMRPTSLGQRVAIENTLQDRRRRGRPLDLPAAAPARPVQDAPAAAAPNPGTQADLASGGDVQSQPAVPLASTPAGPAILGRALRESGTGTLWREAPDAGRDGEWWYEGGYGHAQRPEVEELAAEFGTGQVREVLLVDPAVARVLEAVSRWRHICTAISPDIGQSDVDDAESDVWAAVDALGEPAGTPPGAIDGWESKIRAQHPDMSPPAVRRGAHAARVLLGAPTLTQPAVDALGEQSGTPPADPPLDQRDEARAELVEARRIVAETVEANHRWAADHAEQAAELAQVTADREALFGTYEFAAAEHERELAAARRDAAADALDSLVGHIRQQAANCGADSHRRGLLRGAYAAERRAAEIRTGTRPVPGSPEPAPAGGEEPEHG